MVRVQKSYSRAKRREQIINQLKIWHQSGYAKEATSYKLAKALGLNASPHFRDILNELVGSGDLESRTAVQSGRWRTKFYLLADRHIITEKFSRRHISIKKRGVAVGQLEMFS